MATEIKMPQLGESVVEGTITKWLKQEGDSVEEDELLVEISTDKVDSEVPSSATGKIQKILVQEGDTVEVGKPIAVIGEGAADGSSEPEPQDEDTSDSAAEAEAKQDTAAAEEAAEEHGETAAEGGGDKDASEAQAAEPESEAQTPEPEPESEAHEPEAQEPEPGGEAKQTSAPSRGATRKGAGDTSKRGIISPLVRRLADEHGVSLDEVEGSGTGGRIRKQDVLAYVESGEAPAAATGQQPDAAATAPSAALAPRKAGEREELVPWTNVRKRTAEHMIASHLETARAWNAVQVDWTDAVGLRTAAKEEFKRREGFNLTYMPFLAKSLCETLLDMPEVNATYDEEQGGNVVKHYVNLGIAVALDGGGLIVPVIKGADEKNLVGLARSINDVATRARSKKLSPDDLSGGSFSITNPGPFGSVVSVPIIPRGQAAILGFEAIGKNVVVTGDDAIAIRSTGFLSLSWDHRAIDGAEAARFLAALKDRIESTDFSGDLAQYV